MYNIYLFYIYKDSILLCKRIISKFEIWNSKALERKP